MHPDIGLMADDLQHHELPDIWQRLLAYAVTVDSPLGLEAGATGRTVQAAALCRLYLAKAGKLDAGEPQTVFLQGVEQTDIYGSQNRMAPVSRCKMIAMAARQQVAREAEAREAEATMATTDPASLAREWVKLFDTNTQRGGVHAILEKLDAIEEPYKSATLAYLMHYAPTPECEGALCLALEQRTY
jgi:hypothetical protein